MSISILTLMHDYDLAWENSYEFIVFKVGPTIEPFWMHHLTRTGQIRPYMKYTTAH